MIYINIDMDICTYNNTNIDTDYTHIHRYFMFQKIWSISKTENNLEYIFIYLY